MEVLKERSKDTLIVVVEPNMSAVLSGEKPSKYSIQGIGTGFIPKNYDASIVDEDVPNNTIAVGVPARIIVKD
ncbi:hypothetical protein [Fusobacterium nucleatum]|uniref:hypothetical protein n=1 Tax=Fusobacterium nucleatum TaxID=851 RepID=UPI0030CC54F0